MDENTLPASEVDASPDTSCSYTSCLLRLLHKKRPNDHLQLVGNSYALVQLDNPEAYTSWPTFLALDDLLAGLASETEILTAGFLSWQHRGLYPYQKLAQSFRDLRDAYAFIFGKGGSVTKLLPCRLQLETIGQRQLRIHLHMQAGCSPGRTLRLLLHGQMAALLGQNLKHLSCVTSEATVDGAIFTIRLPAASITRHRLRQWYPFGTLLRDMSVLLMTRVDSMQRQHRRIEQLSRRAATAEQALAAANYRNKIITAAMTETIWVLDDNLALLYVTPSARRWLGYAPQKSQTLGFIGLLTPATATLLTQRLATALATASGGPPMEIELRHNDGHWLPVAIEWQIHQAVDTQTLQIIIVARSLVNARQLQREIREAAASYEILANHTAEAIININQQHEIILANPSTCRIFGYSQVELAGARLHDLLPALFDDPRTHTDAELAGHGVGVPLPTTLQSPKRAELRTRPRYRTTGLHKDGRDLAIEISLNSHQRQGAHVSTLIIHDVSQRGQADRERQALQQQLHATQRMASVGQLAGGVAHDFNNLLVAINGYAELCLQPGNAAAETRTYLQQIRHAGTLAADMTHKLLAFSRPQLARREIIDVNQLITGLDLLIRRLLPAYIELLITPASNDVLVYADPGQLEQVVINLMINARDAMQGPGELHIHTRAQLLTEVMLSHGQPHRRFCNDDQDGAIQPGHYVVLAISDTGTGISQPLLARIFEPFFTTKPEGQGTGLGLVVVKDIIAQHQASISIISTEGQGSTFEVYLPACTDQYPALREQTRPRIMGGTESLLLVEDSDSVRDLARLILRGVGYQVIEARDGVEALKIYAAHHQHIDLVILDVVLPRLGGREVMAQMRTINPALKLIFTSGYADRGLHTNFIHAQSLPFIQKPYSTDVLCARIRQLLDGTC